MIGVIPQRVKKRRVLIEVSLANNLPCKQGKSSRFDNLKHYFDDYCKISTIHGIKYVGENGRYFLERLIWGMAVFGVCVFCFILVRMSYAKWMSAPIIVSFAAKETSISTIPFPAITICPEVKFDPEVFKFSKTLKRKLSKENLTKEEDKYLQLSYLVCNSVMSKYQEYQAAEMNLTFPYDPYYNLMDMMPVFDPFNFTIVKWLGNTLYFDKDFDKVITTDGVCYIFNMLAETEILRYNYGGNETSDWNEARAWSLEDGYLVNDTTNVYPRKTFISGLKGGLRIESIYTNHSHLDYHCGGVLQGFKVVLHHPCEFPAMEKHFRLPLDQAVFVSVKPSLITVSPELLRYPLELRKCFFAHEKYLASYKIYTQQNCLEECLANYTWEKCRCIPFYSPLLDAESPVCGPASIECVRKSKMLYLEAESYFSGQKCQCLPLCTSLTYDVETSQSDFRWQNAMDSNETIEDMHLSQLNVYYKDLQFLSCERKELFGTIDFLSNVGGLLGLFVGFSLTSAIEVLYFMTLRVACNIKMYGKLTWSGHLNYYN